MRRWGLIALAALGTVALIALGVWQLERREWKLALMARVEQRVHAAPVPAPAPNAWATLSRENAEYLRVTVTGRFIEGRETRVRAVTALGGGFWMMAPLRTDAGFVVLVNRGFVPPEYREPGSQVNVDASDGADSRVNVGTGREATSRADASVATAAAVADGSGARVTILGLLRITEPRGAFLHTNAPRENRWYSRDVAAIAHTQGLTDTAPYFIDADASPEPGRLPVGGLTVITFHNSHLVYAITWFTLAAMAAALGVRMARSGRPTHTPASRATAASAERVRPTGRAATSP